jgi:hypothetical protein
MGKRRKRRATRKGYPPVVWSNWNARFDTAPVPGDHATHAGRYRCVSYGRRQWQGPRVLLSRGRVMAPHSPRPLALYAPLSPAHLSALGFSPSSRYQTPLSRFFSHRCVARTSPCRTNPIPSFPTRTSIGSAPWRCCSPPRVPLVIPLHAASVFGALHHHLRPPDYNCHLVCLSSTHL